MNTCVKISSLIYFPHDDVVRGQNIKLQVWKWNSVLVRLNAHMCERKKCSLRIQFTFLLQSLCLKSQIWKAIAGSSFSVLELVLIFVTPLKPYLHNFEATSVINVISVLDISSSIQMVIYIAIAINYTAVLSRSSE